MRNILGIALLGVALAGSASAEMQCWSTRTGDEIVSTCQDGDIKTVNRCSANGCTLDTNQEGPTGASFNELQCRIEGGDWCKKVQDDVANKTLSLCDKGVFEKPYCDAYKAKLASKGN